MSTSRLHCFVVMAALFASSLPGPASAASIEVIGTAGVAGSNGANGNPAGNGSPGGDGAPAVVEATGPDATNLASTLGGAGGNGGNGGNAVPSSNPTGTGGAGGSGGSADALATVSTSGDGSAQAFATGGVGGLGGVSGDSSTAAAGGNGGDAQANASANSAGRADARSTTQGGHAPGGDAGDAESHSTAVSAGDGHDATAQSSASGGLAGGAPNPFGFQIWGPPGRGGTARATSTATATGNSGASAFSSAWGGRGISLPGGDGTGGNALADAHATGAGTGSVGAIAKAIGGESYEANSSVVSPVAVHLGLARANAFASGLGSVTAGAIADGGGRSSADARAESAGRVTAVGASVATGPDTDFATFIASASLRDASVRDQVLGGLPYAYETVAMLNADPGGKVGSGAWLDGNPNVSGALAGDHRVIAEGAFYGNPRTARWTSSVNLDIDGSSLPLGQDITLGFLDATVPALGFNALEVHISLGTDHIADWIFSDAASAEAALEDTLVPMDLAAHPSDPVSQLVITFISSTSGAVATFSSNFVLIAHTVDAPEPAAVLLATFAIATLFARRHMRIWRPATSSTPRARRRPDRVRWGGREDRR